MSLITKKEYDQLDPYQQGYVQYFQGEQPGSELKGLTNPYADGTPQHTDWKYGEFRAILAAQDSEE